VAGIIGGASTESDGGSRPSAGSNASITHRARSVLAIRGFRRLWGVTYLCSIGDWLSLLALTSLVTKMTEGYSAQSFAFAGVVLTQLLPGLLFAPLGGLFADRFDRRKVMIICDVLRCALFVSIAVVGTPLWLFIANFLIGCCSMMWIPSKDAAVPNLLRRSDQVETAAQLGLVMTYGIAAISGAGLYAIITGVTTNLNIQPDPEGMGIAKIIVVVIGALYLTSALLIATRIPELSSRDTPLAEARKAERKAAEESGEKLGFGAMVRDAGRFVRTTPLVRGLLIGMVGAFAAAGALIASANLYASSLRGGASAFGLLMVAMFIGLATGMAGAPKLARRLPHNRLFGLAIVLRAS
jgi:dTMP kinase